MCAREQNQMKISSNRPLFNRKLGEYLLKAKPKSFSKVDVYTMINVANIFDTLSYVSAVNISTTYVFIAIDIETVIDISDVILNTIIIFTLIKDTPSIFSESLSNQLE